jgi:hypothetical protein
MCDACGESLTRFTELACSRAAVALTRGAPQRKGEQAVHYTKSKRALAAGDPIKQGGSYLIQIKPETPNALIG